MSPHFLVHPGKSWHPDSVDADRRSESDAVFTPSAFPARHPEGAVDGAAKTGVRPAMSPTPNDVADGRESGLKRGDEVGDGLVDGCLEVDGLVDSRQEKIHGRFWQLEK